MTQNITIDADKGREIAQVPADIPDWGPTREIGVAVQYDTARNRLPTGSYVCLALYRGDNDDRIQFRISRGLAETLRAELDAALSDPKPSTYRNVPWSPTREAEARAVYETWSEEPGYVPWVPGGNSLKQDEARDIVMRRVLAVEAL